MKPNVFIRCDSSALIGSGHIMRCINLARELFKSGAKIEFLCRDLSGNVMERVSDAGFTVRQISSGDDKGFILDEIRDAEETTSMLSLHADRDPIVIVDHYGAGLRWQNKVKSITPHVVVIDDLADHPHNCEILVNQNLYPEGKGLYKGIVSTEAQVLIGPQYALLPARYSKLRPHSPDTRENVERIIISFGGSDLNNSTQKSLEASVLAANKNVRIDVVVGKNHPDKESLRRIAEQHRNVTLFDYVENFAEFLHGSDIMIGAGGVTQWERCCLGIPGIIISIADNQRLIADNIARAGAGIYEGWHNDVTTDHIHSSLYTLITRRSLRQQIAESAFVLTDGKGAKRVADRILSLCLTIRQATLSDIDTLYEWRNHEEIRTNSHNSEIIPYDDHCTWIKNSLQRPDREILIAQNHDGTPVGVIRFDYKGQTAVISVYLGPHFIGQGIGTHLLKIGTRWIAANKLAIKAIHASIKTTNTRSRKAFLAAGYRDCGTYFKMEI